MKQSRNTSPSQIEPWEGDDMTTWHRYMAPARAHVVLRALIIVALTALFGTFMLAPTSAFAVEAGTGGVAALQIAQGASDDGSPDLAVNACYGFDTGDTWKDLLDKAVAAGDLEGYVLSDWGFPESFTIDGQVVANASDWSTYWSSSINGDSNDPLFSTGNYTTITLANETKYQAGLDAYPSVLDWSKAPDPEGCTSDTSEDQDGSSDDQGSSADNQTSSEDEKGDSSSSEREVLTTGTFDDKKAQDVIAAITQSYKGTALSWNTMDLVAACQASLVDKNGVIKNAQLAYHNPDATSLQRSIIALTALGVDATEVPSEGAKLNLIDKLAHHSDAVSTIYAQAFTLLAYKSGPYEVPSDASKSVPQIIDALLASQLDNGGFSFDGQHTDADTTAMILTALAAYADEDGVQAAIDKGLDSLKSIQKTDGGFGSTLANVGSNAPSTAQVIIALAALGIDPETWTTSTGATPMSYLLSTVNAEGNGFLYEGKESDFATEQGLRALLAYKGMKAAKGPYNMYLQAKETLLCANGAAKTESDTVEGQKNNQPKATNTSNSSNISSTTQPSALAPTGDESMLILSIVAFMAFVSSCGAMATQAYAQRAIVHAKHMQGDSSCKEN